MGTDQRTSCPPEVINRIAAEVLAALDSREQLQPFSARTPGFDLAAAYQVTAQVRDMRKARGENPIGRKLGFTNSNIWDEYAVYAPIWGYVYDSTVSYVDPRYSEFDLSRVVEPRIEPEITLAFKTAPEPGMDEAEILACVDWVAHGFEVVQSLFPGWKFAAADTIAAFGLHGALMLGPRHHVTASNRTNWLQILTSFTVSLTRNGADVDRGTARNVLGGPLTAMRNAIEVLSRDPFNTQIAAGEIVTTGTVTRAFPMHRGEQWASAFSGAPFEGLHIALQ